MKKLYHIPNKIITISFVLILFLQPGHASVALEFDEFSEAPSVLNGIENWTSFIEKDLNASEEWCMVISAYIGDSALISSLGRYVLYCGFYRMNEENLVAVPYYTENQFNAGNINSDLNLHSTCILLKNFWEPVRGVNLKNVFNDSKQLKSLSVGENVMFGASIKTVLLFKLNSRLVKIEVKGNWNPLIKQELVEIIGEELVEIIDQLVQESEVYKEKSLRLGSQM